MGTAMQIQDLAIPDTLKQQYLGQGIRELIRRRLPVSRKGCLTAGTSRRNTNCKREDADR